MVSLDLFLFHEFGLTSLTNVHKINGCSAKINALSAEQTANADSPQGTQVSQVLERNAEIR